MHVIINVGKESLYQLWNLYLELSFESQEREVRASLIKAAMTLMWLCLSLCAIHEASVNSSSLFSGWLVKIQLSEPDKLPDDLLSEEEYHQLPELVEDDHWI